MRYSASVSTLRRSALDIPAVLEAVHEFNKSIADDPQPTPVETEGEAVDRLSMGYLTGIPNRCDSDSVIAHHGARAPGIIAVVRD
jgi:hypothetical protein